jgi:sulfotransferase family protein
MSSPSPVRELRLLARRALLALVPPLRRSNADRARLRRELAAQATQLAELRAELANAHQRNGQLRTSPERQVDPTGRDLGYLFIITYGRSGSTLLQGILDSIPGYLIRGENRNAVFKLFEFQRVILTEKNSADRGDRSSPRSSWYGLEEYDADVALAGMRALVLTSLLRPEPDTRVIGFKEIRWYSAHWREYLLFLQQLFPGARFIINTRDNETVLQSKWWTQFKTARADLERYEKQLAEMTEFLGDAVYRLHYDEWVADPDTLAGLYAWLGEPFDRAAIDEVMAVRHSY